MMVLEEFNYNYVGIGFYIILMYLILVYKFIQRKKKYVLKCWLYGIENLFVVFNVVDKSQ